MNRYGQIISHLAHARAWLANNNLPGDVHVTVTADDARISVFTCTAEEMREARRVIGPMTKVEFQQRFTLDGESDGIRFVIFPPDSICKRVKVGERVEQVTKEVRPAETVTAEETVDVFEWDCGGVLVTDDVVQEAS